MFFSQPWNANAASQSCTQDPRYGGVLPRQMWFTTYFGGREIDSSNIVFSNGKLDPWARQGVLPAALPNATFSYAEGVLSSSKSSILDLGTGSLALLIDLSAHHLDLFFTSENDPVSVVNARQQEMAKATDWIAERKQRMVVRHKREHVAVTKPDTKTLWI